MPSAPTAAPTRRRSTAGCRSRSPRRSSRAGGQDLAAAVGRGQAAGLQAGAARADRLDRLRQRDPPLRLEERRSASCPGASGPTNTCSTPRTGTISAAARPMPRATTSATARSTTPPAPPRWSRSAEAHAKAGPARAHAGVPGGHRRGIGPARLANTTAPTRSSRWRRPSAGSTWTRSRWPGRRSDVTVDRRRQERARRAISHAALAASRPRRDARADAARRATTTAPTTSASPSAACRCSTSTAGEDLGRRAAARRARRGEAPIAPTLPRAERRVRSRLGLGGRDAGPASSTTASAACWPRPRAGRTGTPATNSARIRDKSCAAAGGC